MDLQLEILYQDEAIVAVNKPHGIAVHPSKMHKYDTVFALQTLRDQLNQKVYPAHRLDKKTSGILLFALTEQMNSELQQMFMNNEMKKTYHALVRGFVLENDTIDYPLTTDSGKEQEAITHYKVLKHYEINVVHGKFNTSRYSLLNLQPETGRFHQLRKHLAHLRHPIINDRPHGCNKQNKLWKHKFDHDTMLLHAQQLQFIHPSTKASIHIEAPYSIDFQKAFEILENLKH